MYAFIPMQTRPLAYTKTTYTNARVKEGARRAGVVSMYARAYHPIRSPALGLLNATSVQLPRTLGIYLSIHLLEGRMEAGGRGGRRGGCLVLRSSQHR